MSVYVWIYIRDASRYRYHLVLCFYELIIYVLSHTVTFGTNMIVRLLTMSQVSET